MKNFKLRFTVLAFIVYFIVGLPSQIFAQSCPGQQLRLEGLELAKGVNLTNTFRVGTIFAGEVFCEDSRIGRWTAMLSHKGTEEIEVCKGRGSIFSMRLSVNFNSGEKLVLKMADLPGEPKVEWDYIYTGEDCLLGGLNCEHCGEVTSFSKCEFENSPDSDLAMVSEINLRPSLGTTMSINGAILQDGWLCHYYPLIPRVSAVLMLY
jgi:hypothetical protein